MGDVLSHSVVYRLWVTGVAPVSWTVMDLGICVDHRHEVARLVVDLDDYVSPLWHAYSASVREVAAGVRS